MVNIMIHVVKPAQSSIQIIKNFGFRLNILQYFAIEVVIHLKVSSIKRNLQARIKLLCNELFTLLI